MLLAFNADLPMDTAHVHSSAYIDSSELQCQPGPMLILSNHTHALVEQKMLVSNASSTALPACEAWRKRIYSTKTVPALHGPSLSCGKNAGILGITAITTAAVM